MKSVPDTPTAEGLRPVPRRRASRFWIHAVVFIAAVVLVDALFGDRGLMESYRARRAYTAAEADLQHLREENAQLRDEARRLRSDAPTIEAVARGELGLARPGEILVTVHDLPH